MLIGDAAHTMSPAGAIGVYVALSMAAIAAQEIYPRLGRGPIARSGLFPIVQRRLFFGAPLPPLDPAFRFEA